MRLRRTVKAVLYSHIRCSPSNQRLISTPSRPRGRKTKTSFSNVAETEIGVTKSAPITSLTPFSKVPSAYMSCTTPPAVITTRLPACSMRSTCCQTFNCGGATSPLTRTSIACHNPRKSGIFLASASVQPAKTGDGISAPYPPAGVNDFGISSTLGIKQL